MSDLRNLIVRAPLTQIQKKDIYGNNGGPLQDDDALPRTRCGYLVPEAYKCYEQALGETGAKASGKALHFAADIICSGGLTIWIRGAYSYAVQHIGISSPRIFVYLRQRVSELDKKEAVLPDDMFYNNPEVQSIISETVLIMQLCQKRAKVVWPKIDETTKRPNWIRGVANAPETAATRKVYSSSEDSSVLYLVGNELCKAVSEGATEKALFWIRWCMEEDNRVRKEFKNYGLSRKERGPLVGNNKAKNDAGHYCAAILVEVYKELAGKELVKMNEEFQELLRLWRGGESRMANTLRRDCLGWMAMICTEVPKWKVPATPSLVQDPIRLSRAVSQGSIFFKEVLANPPLAPSQQIKQKMMKQIKKKKEGKKGNKSLEDMNLEEHLEAMDAVLDAYLGKI